MSVWAHVNIWRGEEFLFPALSALPFSALRGPRNRSVAPGGMGSAHYFEYPAGGQSAVREGSGFAKMGRGAHDPARSWAGELVGLCARDLELPGSILRRLNRNCKQMPCGFYVKAYLTVVD